MPFFSFIVDFCRRDTVEHSDCSGSFLNRAMRITLDLNGVS